ncbi:hypothetical protein ACOMHN_062788 [Nucella lapillus]
MSLKPNQETGDRYPRLKQQAGDTKAHHVIATDVHKEGKKMGTIQKMTLTASLFSNEAICSFEHIYTVPILQTLGLPLSLVTLTGAISGPSATFLLPLLGWWTDRGSNPSRRKTIATMIVSIVAFTGMLCVLSANLLHLSSVLVKDANTSAARVYDSYNSSGFTWAETSEKVNDSGLELQAGVDGMNGSLFSHLEDDLPREDDSGIPFKAILALMGFVLMDLGVDGSSSNIRSFVLTCSRRCDHTSLLLFGVTMASAGGVSTTALGLVDFPSILGLNDTEGAGLTTQTAIQAAIIISLAVLCLPTTLLTVRRLLKQRSSSSEDTTIISNASSSQPPSSEADNNILHEGQMSRSMILDAFENSIRSFGGSIHFDRTLTLLGELQRSHSLDHHTFQNSASEHAPLLPPGKARKEHEEDLERSQLTSTTVSYRRRESLCDIPEHTKTPETSMGDLSEKTLVARSSLTYSTDMPDVEAIDTEGQSCRCERGFRLKVFLLSVATYFSASDVYLFAMTGSDFVGKAIYRGDPSAPPGSPSVARYEQGVRMASVGFFIYFISVLINSFLLTRILARVGYRVLYILVHLLLAAAMVAASVTERLEMFFVLAVMAGAHRTCFFTVPFAAMNDLIQARASEMGRVGKTQMGFAFSILMATMPMSYCTLFSWIGPVEEATGVVAVPFFTASITSLLSVGAFLVVGKI